MELNEYVGITNAEFRQLPEIKVRLYLRANLEAELAKFGLNTHTHVSDVNEAVTNVILPEADIAILNSLEAEDQEMLLKKFTSALANLIHLHEINSLPINWDTVLFY